MSIHEHSPENTVLTSHPAALGVAYVPGGFHTKERAQWFLLVIALVSLAIDTLVIKDVYIRFFGVPSELVGWACAILTAVLLAGIMVAAGKQQAQYKTHGNREAFTLVWAFIGIWIVLTLALAWARYASLAVGGIQIYSENAAAATLADDKALVTALMFTFITVAAGISAFYEGRLLADPVIKRYRFVHNERINLEEQIIQLTTALKQYQQEQASRARQLEQLPESLELHKKNAQSLADEVKTAARVRILEHVADPAAAGITMYPAPETTAMPEVRND